MRDVLAVEENADCGMHTSVCFFSPSAAVQSADEPILVYVLIPHQYNLEDSPSERLRK